jgi:hypothetical protein
MSQSTYSVQFVGYVIQDEFTEYHLKVTCSADNSSWLVRRRYREFRELHDHLKLKYPDRIPSVPGKKLWGNQDPDFVRQRQDQLQVYMNGILSLEPDCRTRVLQRFLEIKRPNSGGSPVIEPQTSQVSPVPVPQLAPQQPVSVYASSGTVQPVKNNKEDLNCAIADFEKNVFDLSATPALLDAGEYAARRKQYEAIMSIASTSSTVNEFKTANQTPSPFEAAALTPGAGICEPAKSALSGLIGKGPVATESQLVAFFSLKPNPVSPPVASSSGT